MTNATPTETPEKPIVVQDVLAVETPAAPVVEAPVADDVALPAADAA